ncbi:unnamed protein product, partial [Symbiodinium pilosum]
MPVIFTRSQPNTRITYHDRNHFDGRNHRIQQDGITDADFEVLAQTSEELKSKGFDAFSWEDRAECAPPVDGRRTSIVAADLCWPDC